MVELFCNSQRLEAIGCFLREALLLMFDRILNVTQFEEVSTSGVRERNLGLALPPNFLDLRQT